MYNKQCPNMFPVTGNPNTQLAGNAANAIGNNSPPDLAWDGGNIWFCTHTGTAATAVWSMMSSLNVATPTLAIGNVVGTMVVNRAAGEVQSATVTGTLAITLNGFIPGYSEVTLFLTNGGSSTITWPGNINWITASGTTTSSFSTYGVTLQATGTDVVVLFSPDGGTTVYGKIIR